MASLAILVDDDDNQSTRPQEPHSIPDNPELNNAITIMMTCDHCDDEYCDLGAPLACGHNICSCQCLGECPDTLEEQFARVEFDRVLEQLLWVVPRYE